MVEFSAGPCLDLESRHPDSVIPGFCLMPESFSSSSDTRGHHCTPVIRVLYVGQRSRSVTSEARLRPSFHVDTHFCVRFSERVKLLQSAICTGRSSCSRNFFLMIASWYHDIQDIEADRLGLSLRSFHSVHFFPSSEIDRSASHWMVV